MPQLQVAAKLRWPFLTLGALQQSKEISQDTRQLGAGKRPFDFSRICNDTQRGEPISDESLVRFRLMRLTEWILVTIRSVSYMRRVAHSFALFANEWERLASATAGVGGMFHVEPWVIAHSSFLHDGLARKQSFANLLRNLETRRLLTGTTMPDAVK